MAYPDPRQTAELILKQNLEVSTSFSQGSGPGAYLLGNRDGFLWLAEYFTWIADRISDDAEFVEADPDDHQHLAPGAPFNSELSDEMGLQIGAFSAAHRERVLDQCGISTDRRRVGTSIAQFSSMLDYIAQVLVSFSHDSIAAELAKDLKALIPKAEQCLAKWTEAAD